MAMPLIFWLVDFYMASATVWPWRPNQ